MSASNRNSASVNRLPKGGSEKGLSLGSSSLAAPSRPAGGGSALRRTTAGITSLTSATSTTSIPSITSITLEGALSQTSRNFCSTPIPQLGCLLLSSGTFPEVLF